MNKNCGSSKDGLCAGLKNQRYWIVTNLSLKGEEAQVEEQLPVKQKGVGSLPSFPAKCARSSV